MVCLKRVAPKKFLCKYSLKKGAKIVGILMSIISLICVIVLLLDFFYYRKTKNCSESLLHSIYSYCLNAIIYCSCMFFIHIWFIWGVVEHKASVVLSWVVITTMWWLQGSCYVFILLCINIVDIGLGWIAALCCAIIASIFIAYCILTGYGYWWEIKNRIRVIEINRPETGAA